MSDYHHAASSFAEQMAESRLFPFRIDKEELEKFVMERFENLGAVPGLGHRGKKRWKFWYPGGCSWV